MEHYRSNAPSPANVPPPLPPSGEMPTLGRLNTNLAQGHSSGDELVPPVPPQSASFVDATSVYHHPSPVAGRSPLVQRLYPPSETGRSSHSNLTHAGPLTQLAIHTAPGLLSQEPPQPVGSQDSNTTFAGELTQEALNAFFGPPQSQSQSSSAQHWVSQQLQQVQQQQYQQDPDGESEVGSQRGEQTSRPNTPQPHARSRAPSNATFQTRVSHESVSDIHEVREKCTPGPPDQFNPTISFERLLSNPIMYLPLQPGPDIDGSDLLEDGYADQIREGLKDLNGQLVTEATDVGVGYSAYFLKEPIFCHVESDLPCKADSLNEAILLVIAALDAGVGKTPTDLVYRVLNAPSWTRLAMATLAAITRGQLRSTNVSIHKGNTNLNHSPDKYAIHPSLTRPSTEGSALICMAEQLIGQLGDAHSRNRTIKNAYNHVWETGSKVAEKLAITRLHALAQPSTATIAEVSAKLKADLIQDPKIKAEVENKVKEDMYDLLKAECLNDISEWRRVYREELLTAMRAAVGAPNVPVGPSSSQILRNAEERIREEVTAHFNEMKANFISTEMEHFRNEYTKEDKLTFLDVEAAKLDYGLIPYHQAALARDGRPLKKANTGDKRTRSGSRSSRAPSPEPSTPPIPRHLDLEKTPTKPKGYGKKRVNRNTVSLTPLTTHLPSLPPVLDSPVSAMPMDITLDHQLPITDDLPAQGSQPRAPVIVLPADHNLRSRPPHTIEDTLVQITKPMTSTSTPDGPQPMVRDYHGDLENRAFEIHGRLPGVSASMHAPSRVAVEDPPAPTEEPKTTTAPSLGPLENPSVHPSILALFNHLQNSLSTSLASIFTRLDNQDRTITELSKPRDPRKRTPPKSPSDAPIPAPQPPPEGYPSTLRRTGPPPVPRSTRPQTLLPPQTPKATWSRIVTQSAAHSNVTAANFAKSAAATQGRTTSGKRISGKTGPLLAPQTTQVTVVRGKGLNDEAKESTVHGTPPDAIVNAARSQVERIAKNSITILHGRWSINPKSHNFVYTIAGNVPYTNIYPFRNALIGPLLTGDLVPNQGWTYAQLRNVPTSDADGVVFPPDVLLSEVRRNAAFSNVIFCTTPHWQAHPSNVANYPTSTVTMAFVDESGVHMEAAKSGGIYMFNAQVRFVPTGDHPSITQCGRCHEIGHHTDTPACPLPKNAVRCYICAGSHIGTEHAFHCTGAHKTAGKCDCGFKCLLCKGKHHA